MEDPFLLQRKHAAELFIVRHGDAIPGADEIIPSGIYDDLPLSRIGREQAIALAERLSDTHFDAMYCSPLRRCLETAAPLAERLDLAPVIVPDLKEIRLGEVRPLPAGGEGLDALTKALQDRQIDIVRISGTSGNWDAIENSEPSKAFRKRVVTAPHGGVVNAYVAEVLGLEKDFFFPAANTSITVVRVSGKHRVLFVLNDLAHVKRHG